MKNKHIKNMCLAGVFTALVFVFTAYLHIPSHTGYVHVGDGFIYLAAGLLPLPYAVFVGACGAMLADCLTGFAIWAPGSLLVKAAAVLFFSAKSKKILTRRNLTAVVPAAAVCVGGYYLYEAAITANFISPLAGIPGNITQSVVCAVLFVILGFAADKFGLKQKFDLDVYV